jgi:hypothetical protein
MYYYGDILAWNSIPENPTLSKQIKQFFKSYSKFGVSSYD